MDRRWSICLLLIAFGAAASASPSKQISEEQYYKTLEEQARQEDLLPPSTNVSDIQFWLWTRSNPVDEQELKIGNEQSVTSSSFNKANPTKILVHGWGDHGKAGWVLHMRDEYLAHGDYNIISVHWEKLVTPALFYVKCAENAKPAGRHAADFISFLVSLGAREQDFHPVGFSLGAQFVGNLGHGLGGRLPRITGLDPAGFMFHTAAPGDKLSPGSAQFVDVIHSAGLWIGMDEVAGHADFYPNSGIAPQPGCEGESIGLSCSHNRAPAFFDESINSKQGFEAVLCDSWEAFESGACDKSSRRNWLGLTAKADAHGVFYLRTNAQQPFAVALGHSARIGCNAALVLLALHLCAATSSYLFD